VAKRKLGKYEIKERLGRGGMAEVYRGYHANLDREVAIKVLHAFLADDPEFKSRFEREAQNVAKLKHPNIVQVYDFEYDSDGESYYMVMELVGGPTLKDRLTEMASRGEQMPLEESIRIIREAASALAYAHSRSMIHRDVKPANLMLDHDNRVVLTDFGIAKIVTGAQFTASGGMVGTPAYMAPEQGLGEAGDERSDLYSLGIILFQLVTGKLPYDADTPLAIILKHLNAPIPSVRALNPDVPEAVERIITKAIAKDPADRYQTAADMIEDLSRAERGEAVQAKAVLPPLPRDGSTATIEMPRAEVPAEEHHFDTPIAAAAPPVVPPSRRRRLPWWGLGGIGALLIGSIALAMANGVLGGSGTPTRAAETGTSVAAVVGDGTEEVTPTVKPTLTDTPTVTASSTSTPTPTQTLTSTPTPTSTGTATPTSTLTSTWTPTASATNTATSTNTPTATATPTTTATNTPTITLTFTPSPSFTPSSTWTPTYTPSPTATPTVNRTVVWQTATQLSIVQTMTVAACTFDYEIVDQSPKDGEANPVRTNQEYLRKITVQNTGTCAWEPLTSLAFVQGENFSVGPRVYIRKRVEVGDAVEIDFQGRTPSRGGLRSGTWQLKTPGQISIGKPLIISVFSFEGG
jgi:serine/threonine protein kinase